MPADGAIVVPADLELTGDKTLKLGTNAAFPPFEYVDGSKIVGFDITMGQKIAADAGTKLEVVDMAFDSLIPALASGAIDFIAAGMSVTEERQKNVDFSSPYFESEQVIIIRK
jgi:polar amino acid transport system substrate-binding protein